MEAKEDWDWCSGWDSQHWEAGMGFRRGRKETQKHVQQEGKGLKWAEKKEPGAHFNAALAQNRSLSFYGLGWGDGKMREWEGEQHSSKSTKGSDWMNWTVFMTLRENAEFQADHFLPSIWTVLATNHRNQDLCELFQLCVGHVWLPNRYSLTPLIHSPSFPQMQMALFFKFDRCWQVYCSWHLQTARGCLSQMVFVPLITWRVFFFSLSLEKKKPLKMPHFYLKETACHLSSSLLKVKWTLNKAQPALKQSFVTGGWGVGVG